MKRSGTISIWSGGSAYPRVTRSEEHTSELQSHRDLHSFPTRRSSDLVMLSFLDGLFVGEEEYEAIRDNLDLERWFRLPKSHERRIHGHAHAGLRLGLDGP